MGWLDLLSVAVKLVDMHDSGHQQGLPASSVKEIRAGLGSGLWLHISVALLEYLHEHDIESNAGWIQLEHFIEDMINLHGIKEEDVIYVVNTLSTSTQLNYLSTDKCEDLTLKSTKKTALIERPRHKVSDKCRLSDVGRHALQMSRQASNWLYSQHDAQRILSALSIGDFGDISQQAVVIDQSIKRFSQDITRMLERPGEQEVWDSYKERNKEYGKAIDEVGKTVIKAMEQLVTDNTIEEFERWKNKPENINTLVSLRDIHNKLKNISISVIKLRRKFSTLIQTLSEEKRSVVGNVMFDKVAISVALNQPSTEQMYHCYAALAPWFVNASFPSPVDVIGSLRRSVAKENDRVMSFEESPTVKALPSSITSFLEAHKTKMREALLLGEVSISSAIDKGWLLLDEKTMLSHLVGIYTAPEWLDEEGIKIGIVFKDKHFNKAISENEILSGNELSMFLISQKDSI